MLATQGHWATVPLPHTHSAASTVPLGCPLPLASVAVSRKRIPADTYALFPKQKGKPAYCKRVWFTVILSIIQTRWLEARRTTWQRNERDVARRTYCFLVARCYASTVSFKWLESSSWSWVPFMFSVFSVSVIPLQRVVLDCTPSRE